MAQRCEEEGLQKNKLKGQSSACRKYKKTTKKS